MIQKSKDWGTKSETCSGNSLGNGLIELDVTFKSETVPGIMEYVIRT
jgi:hypothetical protein